MSPRPFPMHDHPLTEMYIKGAMSRDYIQMRAAMEMAAFLELSATEQEKAACKLAAEVIMERSRSPAEKLPLDLNGLH